jgi:glutamate synthase (NADPH/NADH) small chain
VSDNEIKLQISDDVKKCLEERHILEDEIKQVIHHAETEGDKLYQPETNNFLAKLKIGNATFYAKYSIEGKSYLVQSAYAHKSEILG